MEGQIVDLKTQHVREADWLANEVNECPQLVFACIKRGLLSMAARQLAVENTLIG
jgi:hypothetical protein